MTKYENPFSKMTLLIKTDNTTRKTCVKIIDYERGNVGKKLRKFSGLLFKQLKSIYSY